MTDLVTPAETARAGRDQLCLDDESSLPLAYRGLSAEQPGVVLQYSFDTITVLEPDGTVPYSTPAAQRISGYPDAFECAAAAQAAEWQRAQREPARFRLAVNLSGRQLQDPDLPTAVGELLDAVGFDPQALCVEITEGVLMEDADVGVGALKVLKAIGVRVSVDDFGTGYSSLGYLRRFAVDEVKIDRSFVARLGPDPADAAIVAAVVSLGHALGVSVVGEGVETETQLDVLRELGADAAQGFLLAPPNPRRISPPVCSAVAPGDSARGASGGDLAATTHTRDPNRHPSPKVRV